MQVTGGDTNVAAYFMVRLAADGTAATGLTVTNFDLQYTRTLTAAATVVDGIVGTGGATTHVDDKVFEIDATSSPGLYLVCFADAAFAAGVPEVHLALTNSTDSAFAEVIKCQIDTPVILANNVLHGGSVALITLERVVVASTTSAQPAVRLTGNTSGEGLECVGGNVGDGARFTGTGAGGGIALTGGATGHGLNVIGGVDSGNAIRAFANGTNDAAIEAIGIGTGAGILATGGGTSGAGIQATGGSSDGIGLGLTGAGTGDGLFCQGGATGSGAQIFSNGGNSPGLAIAGDGTSHGLILTAGATGTGLRLIGGATSGDALSLSVQDAGNPPNQLTPGVPFGTVTDASATATSFDTSLTEAVDDFYNDSIIVFLDGNLEGSQARITDYDGTGTVGDITIASGDLTAAPDNGSAFMVIGRATA